jgi:hypothetical protein
MEAAIHANSNGIVWLALQHTKSSKTVFHAAAPTGNNDLARTILIDNRASKFVNHVGPAGTALCEAASGANLLLLNFCLMPPEFAPTCVHSSNELRLYVRLLH